MYSYYKIVYCLLLLFLSGSLYPQNVPLRYKKYFVKFVDDRSIWEKALNVAGLSNKDVVSLLLDRGANINAVNLLKETPLHLAVWIGDVDVVSILVEAGANRRKRDTEDYTPFMLARDKGFSKIIKILKEGLKVH